jgi:putative methyltransferase
VFDQLIADNPSIAWHASQETHRGCPYSCTFCDWGSAVYTKIRQFDQTRLISELEWFGDNKIDLLYNCDANYGIYARDIDLTTAMVNTKQRLGYPRKFRASYAKKSDSKVFAISKLLNDAGMSKGVTLSMQSMDAHTLDIIKRRNIAIEDFRPVVERYRQQGIPTYTELIIGLPGETLASYKAGIETLLQGGQHDNLVIYTCMVLRNSEMADPMHMAAQGIVKQRVPLMDNHASTRSDEIPEYNDIVIATHSMPHADWRQAYMISWIVQALHCLGLTQYLAMDYWRVNDSYIAFYEKLMLLHQGQPTLLGQQIDRIEHMLDRMLDGADDLGQSDHRFGDINWPVEELTFLQLKLDSARFYEELRPFLQTWMTEQHIADAVDFQQHWILCPGHSCHHARIYSHDIPAMIAGAQQGNHGPVQVRSVKLDFTAKNYYNNIEDWAREIVWYGRKQTLHKRHIHVVD